MNIETDFRNAIRSIAQALAKNITVRITEANEALVETKI